MPSPTNTYERTYSANSAMAVTPDNAASVAFYPTIRAIYVGVGGNISVTMPDDTTVLLKNVPTGAFLPLSVKRINSTSTTATDIVAFQ